MTAKHSSFSLFQQAVIAFVISLLVLMLSYYGIQLVNPRPLFESEIQKSLQRCLDTIKSGEKEASFLRKEGSVDIFNEKQAALKKLKGERDEFREKIEEERSLWTEEVLTPYYKKFFYLASAMGLFFLIIGSFFSLLWTGFAGGLGFILGGIGTLMMSYLNTWQKMNNAMIFFSLLSALLVLVILSFLLMRKREENR